MSSPKNWFVGSDHAGFSLKADLVAFLKEQGDMVFDLGCDKPERCDYPDFAAAVGARVAAEDGLGLLCCGTGIGMSIAANKLPGVRAAVVSSVFEATATRQHNDANVLCLGQRVVGVGVAKTVLAAFREASFEGGRHAGRVEKISALEGTSKG